MTHQIKQLSFLEQETFIKEILPAVHSNGERQVSPHLKKNLGAYYTDQIVANFLVSWAIRGPSDKVLDPSCGEGVFLTAASKHFESLGIHQPSTIFGVDIQSHLGPQAVVSPGNLIESDFFNVEPLDLPEMEAIVGNPPFIRYQRFNGDSRKAALKICRQVGTDLPELASSWAPFLIHATRFLKPGGRLAMVVPAEINHAAYALPVIRYFLEKFRSIRIIAFRQRIFPDLNQDTFCMLADGYREACCELSLIIADSALSLFGMDLEHGIEVDVEAIRTGKSRLIEYLIPDESRRIYSDLVQESNTRRLGDLAEVGIGYVTGANDYFHLSTPEVRYHEIHPAFLKPAIRSGRQLQGIRFTCTDWDAAEKAGEKVWLLHIPPDDKEHPETLNQYLEMGVANQIHEAYKCRVRERWYAIPHVYVGGAFLSYMSGNAPRLVANAAKAVASNALHLVHLRQHSNLSAEMLAALWHTSFTMMSSEIEGHALGGGMLKLEPSEAEKVRILLSTSFPEKTEITRLDHLLRAETYDSALDYADETFLIQKFGLTVKDCIALREGYHHLRMWRMR